MVYQTRSFFAKRCRFSLIVLATRGTAVALLGTIVAHCGACSTTDIASVVTASLISDTEKAKEFLKILGFSKRIDGKEEMLLHGFIWGILHAFVLENPPMTPSLQELNELMLQRLEYMVFSEHGGGAFPESLSGALANRVAAISEHNPYCCRRFLTMAWRNHSEEVLTPLGKQMVNEFSYKVFKHRLEPMERARAVAEFLEKKAAT